MAQKYKAKNSIISFVALAFLLYFVIFPMVLLMLSDLLGSADELITNAIDLFPFGEAWYYIAVKILAAFHSQGSVGVQLTRNFSFYYFMSELVKGLFSAVIFEAINLFAGLVMGLDGSKGFWNKGKLCLMNIANAFLSAWLAPFLIGYIMSSLGNIGNVWAALFSVIPTGIIVLGGVAFFMAYKGLSLGKSVCYVGAKFLFLDMLRLGVTYISTFLVILGWQNGFFIFILGGISGLLGVALMLFAIDLMLEAAFK